MISMKHSVKTGFSFGVTSGIITTLGLMIGLYSGTHSQLAVIGGILTIAIADAFSDALGIHISEESRNIHGAKEIWESTLATFATKFIVALSFVVPVLLLPLADAIIAGGLWGLLLLTALSIHLAHQQRIARWKVVMEHVLIAGAVIILTHYVGDLIAETLR
jgi:VIT1/CCC1 family predicted Fe2+/Mn2+ transporter